LLALNQLNDKRNTTTTLNTPINPSTHPSTHPRHPHQVDLGDDDQALYTRLEDESRALVGRSIDADTLMSQYTDILTIIMRLRQVGGGVGWGGVGVG